MSDYKEIPLTRGYVAKVDPEDFDYLNQWKWHRSSLGYAVRGITIAPNSQTLLRMHREILKPTNNDHIDHINGDKLDNRKSNLRICTRSQNGSNRGLPKSNTSGFKGVTFHKRDNRYQAQIKVNSKTIHLGYFQSVTEAAKAYNEAALRLFGEFAWLNEID